MEILQAIAKRKSTRAFKPETIAGDTLNTILSAGCAAPVARGLYGMYHLTVIQDAEILKRVSGAISKTMAAEGDLLYGAPCVVLLSAKNELAPNVEYASAGCILENMMLTAASLDVDSVFIWSTALAVNASPELQKALSLPQGFVPVASLALGHAATPTAAEKQLGLTIAVNRV